MGLTLFYSRANYVRAGGTPSTLNLVDGEHVFPYCCPECKKTLLRTRPKNDKTKNSEREGFNRNDYNRWRQGVFSFYKGKCFLTGYAEREKLQAHHLNSWSSHPEGRYLISNGVLISENIHKEFHRLYGPHTTLAEFENFAEKNYNITVFPWETSKETLEEKQKISRTQQSLYHEEMLALIKERGYTYIGGIYRDKLSIYTVYCPKHNVTHTTCRQNFNKATTGMPCCVSEAWKVSMNSEKVLARAKKTVQNKCQQKIVDLAKERNHTIVEGVFESKETIFTFFCNIHKETYKFSYKNYTRNKFGATCCRRAYNET